MRYKLIPIVAAWNSIKKYLGHDFRIEIFEIYKKFNSKNVLYIASKEEQNGMREQWANELFAETTEIKK